MCSHYRGSRDSDSWIDESAKPRWTSASLVVSVLLLLVVDDGGDGVVSGDVGGDGDLGGGDLSGDNGGGDGVVGHDYR
ncbi:hypothetical protein PENTCL1PPCAC_5182, partial [Pristionchus entomophagus]